MLICRIFSFVKPCKLPMVNAKLWVEGKSSCCLVTELCLLTSPSFLQLETQWPTVLYQNTRKGGECESWTSLLLCLTHKHIPSHGQQKAFSREHITLPMMQETSLINMFCPVPCDASGLSVPLWPHLVLLFHQSALRCLSLKNVGEPLLGSSALVAFKYCFLTSLVSPHQEVCVFCLQSGQS